jgi:uncharacterized protein YjbI with pentapeptide repeats
MTLELDAGGEAVLAKIKAGGDLRGSAFSSCQIVAVDERLDLRDLDLTDASFNRLVIMARGSGEVDARGLKLDRASARNATLGGRLDGASLVEAFFSVLSVSGSMRDADLRDLEAVLLHGAPDLSGANLENAIIGGGNMAGVKLVGANRCNLDGADLTGAERAGAKVPGPPPAPKEIARAPRVDDLAALQLCVDQMGASALHEGPSCAAAGVGLARTSPLADAEAQIALEAERGTDEGLSRALCLVVPFAKAKGAGLDAGTITDAGLSELYELCAGLYPELLRYSEWGPSWNAERMRAGCQELTGAELDDWLHARSLPDEALDARSRRRRASLRKGWWSSTRAALAPRGSRATVWPINENDENTETALYFVAGARAALIIAQRWVL